MPKETNLCPGTIDWAWRPWSQQTLALSHSNKKINHTWSPALFVPVLFLFSPVLPFSLLSGRVFLTLKEPVWLFLFSPLCKFVHSLSQHYTVQWDQTLYYTQYVWYWAMDFFSERDKILLSLFTIYSHMMCCFRSSNYESCAGKRAAMVIHHICTNVIVFSTVY